jgi:gluconate 2-dehydrogenase gamma chain
MLISYSYYLMHENEWLISRKLFVKTLILSGVALQIPWLQSCDSEEKIGSTEPLSLEQFKTLRAVQDILFPADGSGPSARDINAAAYLVWVLNDSRLDPDENNYIIEQLDKFEVECAAFHGDAFFNLSQGNQEDFIASISNESWGKKWLSRLITFIFEALLLDPSYGSNTNEVGWEWLSHNPGQPRPTQEILYPEIFEKL